MSENELPAEIANEPRWRDGLPQNLPAAALDGLEWLRFLLTLMESKQRRLFSDDSRAKVKRTIQELEKHLEIELGIES